MPKSLAEWIASIRELLQKATASKPTPPADLARATKKGCPCQYCDELKKFLSDPEREHADILAREDIRHHLQMVIRDQKLDVVAEVCQSKRRYSLSLAKSTQTYQNALKQFESDLTLLASLDSPNS